MVSLISQIEGGGMCLLKSLQQFRLVLLESKNL